MVPAVQQFIVDHMGHTFVEPPTFDLSLSYQDSSASTPLVFVLSPGADPMAVLFRFAEEKGDRVTPGINLMVFNNRSFVIQAWVATNCRRFRWDKAKARLQNASFPK
jgi:hypothetical protein